MGRRSFLGEPEAVAEKILAEHELFGMDRFLLQLTVGTLPHAEVMRAIEHIRDVLAMPILMVTHDPEEADRLGTRIVRME